MDYALIEQGFNLLLFGMGTVFTFLVVLVLCTLGMSRGVTRFFPEAPPTPAALSSMPSAPAQQLDATTLKVIQTAIDRHRGRG